MCLALAAASFHYGLAWPARAALAVPFLLTAAQALKPDNSESLALRLWEDKMMGLLYTIFDTMHVFNAMFILFIRFSCDVIFFTY